MCGYLYTRRYMSCFGVYFNFNKIFCLCSTLGTMKLVHGDDNFAMLRDFKLHLEEEKWRHQVVETFKIEVMGNQQKSFYQHTTLAGM